MTVVWLGQTAGPLAVTPGFIPISCTSFWGNHSLWLDILLSLDLVERVLDLPQSNVPTLSEECKGGVGVKVKVMGGEKGVGTMIGR